MAEFRIMNRVAFLRFSAMVKWDSMHRKVRSPLIYLKEEIGGKSVEEKINQIHKHRGKSEPSSEWEIAAQSYFC